MKRSVPRLLFLVLVCACGTMNSQGMSSVPAPNGESAELERLSTQWTDAALRHDRPKLEELMAPEYVLHTPDQKRPATPRALWLDNLYNNLKIDHWTQADVAGHVYGDVGVVTSTYAWNGTFHGQAFDSKGYCTDVWRPRDKHWQVVSRTCMAFPGSLTLDGKVK